VKLEEIVSAMVIGQVIGYTMNLGDRVAVFVTVL